MTERSRRFFVDQRAEWHCIVLGPNPDASVYTADHLLICSTDSREDAELIAAALNAYPPAEAWPHLYN